MSDIVYGIAHTSDGSPTGSVISWKQENDGIDCKYETYPQALEANDLYGWRGYVREYPSGKIPDCAHKWVNQ